MKIVAIADIHGNDNVIYLIQELQGMIDFDAVVIAGDITDFGPAEFARELINALPGKVLAIPGNCDPPEVIDEIEKSHGINIHMKTALVNGYRFVGLGGVNSGFSMGIKFTDDFAMNLLGNCRNCIFVTHQPPYGFLDEVMGGKHIGSMGIRKAIDLGEPPLVISGHVHEGRGYIKYKKTVMVNPGPAKEGYAAVIDMEKQRIEMIER